MIEKVFAYFNDTCEWAVKNNKSLVFAIDAVDDLDPVFSFIDVFVCENQQSSFFNAELHEFLNNMPISTVGSKSDMDNWAFECGYARDRVVAYSRCKAALLFSDSSFLSANRKFALLTVPQMARNELLMLEDCILNIPEFDRIEASEFLGSKRSRHVNRICNDTLPALYQPSIVGCGLTGRSRDEIDAFSADSACQTAMPRNAYIASQAAAATRDSKLGNERFVSLVFAPMDHAILAAAENATQDIATKKFPAYVTIHNKKGLIEHLPTLDETLQSCNSFIVHDAASFMTELHALSSKSGRNHMLLHHDLFLFP